MRKQVGARRQRGVAAVLVGLTLFLLIGFAGLVVDLGRLFVTKSELQSATDACALAAARYVNTPTPEQLRVATNAGILAGNRHRAVMQDNQLAFAAGDVTFSDQLDGTYLPASSLTTSAAAQSMEYVRCVSQQGGIASSFMQLFGYTVATVAASAKASLVPSNVTCIVPVGMCCENAVGGCPSTTFEVGKWYEGVVTPNGVDKDAADASITGSFRWIRLPGESGGNDIKNRILNSGACEAIDATQPVQSENGYMAGVIAAYNSRLGLNAPSLDNAPFPVPDMTGKAYTEMTPEMQTGGVNRPAGATSPRAYLHYRDTAVPANTPYGSGSGNNAIKDGNDSSGLDVPNNYNVVDSSLLASRNNGLSRRLVTLPVVKCGAGGGLADASGQTGTPILAWACMLMIHPIGTGNKGALPSLENKMRLEYVDAANSATSACASGGRPSGPGGTGPRVPGLVQ